MLFQELRKLKPATPLVRLAYIRLAVYFAENPDPEKDKLHPSAWQD